MLRRLIVLLILAMLVLTAISCRNKRVQNPIADLGSKQPDKILFDRAMEALKRNKYDVARLSLQTLINTYPDSEFVARAKLAIADSWYAEHTTSALAQAEIEYKDFITFFPNMLEAAEAQLKVANIHYEQMEKPDRDFTHAKRAEDEYRNLILQYPDSPLVAEAKRRLMNVQEVLAEREFRIGRFYYLRESLPAAIARLKSVTDAYPLYSRADEALFLLGSSHEKQADRVRANPQLDEVRKARYIQQFTNQAAEAYGRIVSRYPVADRVNDAKARLSALKQPIPTPTEDAIAQNKAEEESRGETGRWGKLLGNFKRRPDVAQAAKVGEPTLDLPKQTDATQVMRDSTRALLDGTQETQAIGVERVGTGAPPPNQPVPRSEPQEAAPPVLESPAPAEQSNKPVLESPPPAQSSPQQNPEEGRPAEQVETVQPTETGAVSQGSDATGNGGNGETVNDATAETEQSQSQDPSTSSSSTRKKKKKGRQ